MEICREASAPRKNIDMSNVAYYSDWLAGSVAGTNSFVFARMTLVQEQIIINNNNNTFKNNNNNNFFEGKLY